MTPAEFNPIDPELERAVSEIRDDTIDPAVVEAAANRVWARLVQELPATHIRGCADFQALIPEYRAGRLGEARATLLKDHLHECVACRKVYENKVVAMPAARPARTGYTLRWAAAAAILAAAGLSVWFAVDQFGARTGHAFVQTVNGTLYEVSASGIRPLAAGQDLPDGVELRTAAASDAMLKLRDGSLVELRERSGFSTTQTASDLTIRLVRGSVIVQAAKRRTGHLYVATADCRVSVTGTIFSVSSGVKGSRVSVVQGEVHVSQDNQDKVLHPGDQTVTSASMEPISVRDDISWSRNRERLIQQLESLRAGLQEIHLPALRYSSKLLDRLPASTVFYASIPNLTQYLGEAETVFQQKMQESPELRAWLMSRGPNSDSILEKLRSANSYLGDEIAIVGLRASEGPRDITFLAEVKQDGFPEFLKKAVPSVTVESRPGFVVFGATAKTVKEVAAALDTPSEFRSTPFYARISQAYADGAGLLLSLDLSDRMGAPLAKSGARYLIAEQKEVKNQMESAATLAFDGPRTGMAAWLADPASMGSLDYISPEATFVTGFVVKNPSAIVDQILGVVHQLPMLSAKTRTDVNQQTSAEVQADLAASLGGEFSVSLDGAPFPVPSWKVVAEVYDPNRLQATLRKVVEAHDQAAAKSGDKAFRTSQETVGGQTYYMIGSGDPNPLTEVYYTFVNGYMIAGPTRALVTHALQMKTAGTSITHSSQFISMTPRDHYANFSAVIYENLGTTLAPLAGLLSAFAPSGHGIPPNGMQSLSNMKPVMFAAYAEPDRITVAGSGNVLGSSMSNLLSGNLSSVVGNVLPFNQFQGTRTPQTTFK